MNGSGPGTAIETPSQLMSLKDLLARQGQQTCTFTSTTNNSQSQGTVYIDNGKMRGNFTSAQNGQTVASHMIVKDGSVYVWSDGIAQGYKMDVSTLTDASSQGSQSVIEATAPVGYNCTTATVDQNVFTLPTDITFNAVGAAMTSPSGAGASAGASSQAGAHAMQCQACESAPDAASRAQCKQALSC